MLFYILGLAIALIGVLYILKLTRDVSWGWASILIVEWYSYTFGVNQGIVGSVHLDPVDLVTISLLIAGVIRFTLRLREGSTSQTLTLAYAGLFAFSLLRGFAQVGVNTAGNEGRGIVQAIIGMTYFFTVPKKEEVLERLLRWFVYYNGALFATGVLAYAGFSVGAVAWAHGSTGGLEDRFLPSYASASIALGFILLFTWNGHRASPRWMRWLTPLLFAMAVLLRSRSVWLMMIAAVVTAPFVDRRSFRKLIPMLIMGGAGTLILGAAFYANNGGVSEELATSAHDAGTWAWRVESWRQLVFDADQTLLTVAVGKPIGMGFWRFDTDSGRYANFPPHSEYVLQYLRVGVLGTCIIVALMVRPIYLFARLQRKQGRHTFIFPVPSAWCFMCLAALVFGVTYTLTLDLWAIIGMANGLLAVRKSTLAKPSLDTSQQLVLSQSRTGN